MASITFGVSGHTVAVQAMYGYNVDLNTAITWSRMANNIYKSYDAGTNLDKRYSSMEFLLTQSNASTFLGIIKNHGRGDQLSFDPNFGMYPFGPDLGDGGGAGDFTCRLVSWNDNGWIDAPYKYHSISIRLFMESSPGTYIPPSESGVGPVTIGTIDNIPSPFTKFIPVTEIDVKALIAENGAVTEVDGGSGNDSFITQGTMRVQHPKAVKLIEYIIGTGRDNNNITFDPGSGAFPFGADMGNGAFNVQILSLGPISHISMRYWDIPITLRYVSG